MIAYIHGYQGPSERKAIDIQALGKRHNEEVLVPVYQDATSYYEAAKGLMYRMNYENVNHIRCVIGVSLGALAAYFIAKHSGALAICINPRFKPWDRVNMVPEWKLKCQEMWNRANAIKDDTSEITLIHNHDDHLPLEDSQEHVDHFYSFLTGGHRCENWETQILPLIERLVIDKRELLKLAPVS